MDNDSMIIPLPNRDTNDDPYTIIPKTVLERIWKDKIGTTIMYCGEEKRVESVTVTDNDIIVELV